MTPVYVVTDIEVDGPNPGENSMLSFASVAVNANGMEINEFEAVLAPLDGATSDPDTMAWFKNYPDAFAAATHNPLPAKDVIKSYIDWVHGLPGKPIFASHPMAFDGMWMDHYLRAFAGIRLTKGPGPGGDFSTREDCVLDRSRPANLVGRFGTALQSNIRAIGWGIMSTVITRLTMPAATQAC